MCRVLAYFSPGFPRPAKIQSAPEDLFSNSMATGAITSDKRIVAALPTIRYLLDNGAAVIACSHLGKPKGERKMELSLAPVAKRLGELLGRPVIFSADTVGPDAKAKAAALKPGEIMDILRANQWKGRFSMKKPKMVLGGAGFYIVLLLCLAVAGVSGYMILFHGNTAAEANSDAAVSVSAPDADLFDDLDPNGPSQEILDPQTSKVPDETDVPTEAPAEMPSVKVDDTPVMATAPNLIVWPLRGAVVAAFSVDKLCYDETMMRSVFSH